MPDTAAPNPPPAAPKPVTCGKGSACKSPAAIALFLCLTALLLGGDLLLKAWSFQTVAGQPVQLNELAIQHPDLFWARYQHEPTPLIPYALNLQLTTNPGMVFGLGKGGRWVFVVVSVIATVFICVLFIRSRASAWQLHIALAFILSGALGNLYDRIRFSLVRDMLKMFPDVHFPFGVRWPGDTTGELWPWIFNLADVALIIGVAMILVMTLAQDLKARRAIKAAKHQAQADTSASNTP